MTSDARGPAARRRRRRRWFRRLRNAVAAAFGPLVIRLWMGTLRIRWVGELVRIGGFPLGPGRGIYVFWHQRMLILAGLYSKSGFRVLISEHGDGEMIARVVDRLGMRAIRGSSTRGGARAVLELMGGDNGAFNVAITPDGPRGPLHHVHLGAIYLASRSGLPLYAVGVASERGARLPTWDGFIVPYPFSRALIHVAPPIRLPPDLDREGLEEARRGLEARLREITDATDREFASLYRQGKRRSDIPGE
jgi:lysophospholipid acyltransferase (LPLAT)-like uncharacterized protein